MQQSQTELKREIDKTTKIVGDFNILLLTMNQLVNDQQGCRRIEQHSLPMRTLYLIRAEYIFFSRAHRTLSTIDQIHGHKTRINTFKRIEIIPSLFSEHNGIRLEISNRKNI